MMLHPHFSLGKGGFKKPPEATERYPFIPTRMAIMKKIMRRADADVEKLEPLHSAGGDIKSSSRYAKQSGSSPKG